MKCGSGSLQDLKWRRRAECLCKREPWKWSGALYSKQDFEASACTLESVSSNCLKVVCNKLRRKPEAATALAATAWHSSKCLCDAKILAVKTRMNETTCTRDRMLLSVTWAATSMHRTVAAFLRVQ